MSFTDSEEARIQAIEQTLNKVQTAIKNLASQQQVRSLNVIRQKEIDNLTTRIEALETLVSNLQKAL